MPPQRTLIRVGIKVGTGWIPVLRRDRRQWRGCAGTRRSPSRASERFSEPSERFSEQGVAGSCAVKPGSPSLCWLHAGRLLR
jgi:hypothetical protein